MLADFLPNNALFSFPDSKYYKRSRHCRIQFSVVAAFFRWELKETQDLKHNILGYHAFHVQMTIFVKYIAVQLIEIEKIRRIYDSINKKRE